MHGGVVFVGVWCALALASAARAGEPVSGGVAARAVDVDAFRFTVEPPRVVVGETREAFITIEARDDDGAPLDVAPPTLQASTGTIGAPARVAAGVFRARFVPPPDAFPHVALVSAILDTADETAVGFVSVALWGRGQAAVKTKPGSRVTVRVGADAFGPVVAGDDGEAVVPILVPPGPEHAIATSVDAVGNESQKTIDLGVPPFNRVAVIALDDVVPGDGSGRARLLAFVVDRKGAPLVQADLRASADIGMVGDVPQALAPGMFELLWKPGAVRERVVPITVHLGDAKLSKATTSVRVIAGAPARAEVVSPRSSMTADEDRRVVVRVAVFDSGGNPVPFGAARVDVDAGRIDGITGGETQKQIAWELPGTITKKVATLRVRSVDGAVLGEARVALSPGRPARLTIAPMPDVVADGSSGAAVVVSAVDAAGNEVVPSGVELIVQAGRIVAKNVDSAARRLRALYVPEARDEDGVVDVRARWGPLETRAAVRVRARPRALLLVGPAVASWWSYGDVTAVGPELSMLLRMPVLDGGVHAGLNVGVHEGIAAASSTSFRAYRTWPLLAEIAWRPLLGSTLGAHLGASGGVIVADVAIDDGAGGELRAIEPALAAAGTAGVAWRLGPGFLEFDARVGWGGVVVRSIAPATPLGAGLVLGYRFGI